MGTVAILCGGRGTRLQEHTHAIPKALVEIGARPILWHVIRIYASQGVRRFLLLTGYLGEQIARYVATADWPEPVDIECIDTGLETSTGGRIALASERLGDAPFYATYADGLADLDLAALAAFHRGHGGLGTMTVVRPRTQFGLAEVDGEDRVRSFEEKPRLDQWVNGGFFRFEPGFLAYLDADSALEDAPLRRLAANGELHAFRHPGFWDCMDTYKDAALLNDLWRAGDAPWAVWEGRAAAASRVR
jgi:glucose-1-phosphate cytidylyltransferase